MTSRPRALPAAARRRALAIDLACAAALAALALAGAAGLGVVAFVCLPLLALGLLWVGGERLAARLSRTWRR